MALTYMSRIEKSAEIKEQISQVKGDVLKEVKRQSRKRTPLRSCFTIAVFLFLSFALWMGSMVAATGLVRVPVLSQFAYNQPQPIHEVELGVTAEVFLEEALARALAEKMRAGNLGALDRSISLALPDSAMTTSLRLLVADMEVPLLDLRRLQIAIDPSVGIEIFVPVKDSVLETAVIVQLRMAVESGAIIVEPTSATLGNLTIPVTLLANVFESLIAQQMAALNDQLIGYARIDAIGFAEGVLLVDGEIALNREGS